MMKPFNSRRLGQVQRWLPWVLGVFALSSMAYAGPGHDHDHDQDHAKQDAPPSASASNNPKRLPEGRVFLPKPSQHQWSLRTHTVTLGQHPQTYELDGTVVMDSRSGGKVQAAQAGRLQGGPRGLPVVGQTVRAGEVLAYVVPTTGTIERSNHLAQQAQLRAEHTLAGKRLTRLQELADTVPRKDIEAAQSELDSLTQRLTAIGAGLSGRDVLLAPVSGVIASTHAVAGQVLEARELVFEVVDPRQIRIEALAYDPAQAQDVQSGTLVSGTQRIALRWVGAAGSLRGQALPLLFAAQAQNLATHWPLGQPVRVLAHGRARVSGLQLPSVALQRNAANQSVVWVKQGPEHFAPRVVTYVPLDGVSVAVTSGLQAGERIVTQGAALLNQIR